MSTVTSRPVVIGAVSLVVVATLLFAAWHWQRVVADHLPPLDASSRTRAEAQAKAYSFAGRHGGLVTPILGTGSMAPYIPAGDPAAVVAYIVTQPGAKFGDVISGTLTLYRPAWAAGVVMHVAVERDRLGWIMSGLHNAHSEPSWRVTQDNFVGIAAQTFTWGPYK